MLVHSRGLVLKNFTKSEILYFENIRVTGFEPAKHEVKVHFLNRLDTLFLFTKQRRRESNPYRRF